MKQGVRVWIVFTFLIVGTPEHAVMNFQVP
jgi:hypothetical protein